MLIRPDNLVTEVRPGQSVLDALREAGKPIRGNCLVGRCGECRCRLVSGRVVMDQPNSLGRASAESGSILSCCSYPDGDIEVES
jgi:ferredoxin-NAD(P)+ reductase (naphthalene dioxygenase ferredoxin-specific)